MIETVDPDVVLAQREQLLLEMRAMKVEGFAGEVRPFLLPFAVCASLRGLRLCGWLATGRHAGMLTLILLACLPLRTRAESGPGVPGGGGHPHVPLRAARCGTRRARSRREGACAACESVNLLALRALACVLFNFLHSLTSACCLLCPAQAFGGSVSQRMLDLGKRVSRKKEFIPPVTGTCHSSQTRVEIAAC